MPHLVKPPHPRPHWHTSTLYVPEYCLVSFYESSQDGLHMASVACRILTGHDTRVSYCHASRHSQGDTCGPFVLRHLVGRVNMDTIVVHKCNDDSQIARFSRFTETLFLPTRAVSTTSPTQSCHHLLAPMHQNLAQARRVGQFQG